MEEESRGVNEVNKEEQCWAPIASVWEREMEDNDDDDDSRQKGSSFTPMIENRGSDETKQKVPDGSTS